MTSTDAATMPSAATGRCTSCRELFYLVDGVVPPHMWPYSTPLLITCSGGTQPAAGSKGQFEETP